jgi:hypothetical protein
MEATGVTPESVSTAFYQQMINLCQSLGGLSSDRINVGLLLGATEYCLGEVRGWLSGGYADMSEADVISMANAVIAAAAQVNTSTGADILHDLDELDTAAATAHEVRSEEIERQIWILWMASLPPDSDLTDLDPIQRHLTAMGLVTNTWYYSDEDARRDLRRARIRAAGVGADRESIGVPSEGHDEEPEPGHH